MKVHSMSADGKFHGARTTTDDTVQRDVHYDL